MSRSESNPTQSAPVPNAVPLSTDSPNACGPNTVEGSLTVTDPGSGCTDTTKTSTVSTTASSRPSRQAARNNPFIGSSTSNKEVSDTSSNLPTNLAGHPAARKIAGVRHPEALRSARKRGPFQDSDIANRPSKKSRVEITSDLVTSTATSAPVPTPTSAPPSPTFTPLTQPEATSVSRDNSVVITEDGGGQSIATTDSSMALDESELGELEGTLSSIKTDVIDLTDEQIEELSKQDYSIRGDRQPRSLTKRAADINASFERHVKAVKDGEKGENETGWICKGCLSLTKRPVFLKGSVSTLRTHISRAGEEHYKLYLASCEEVGAKPHDRAKPPEVKEREGQNPLTAFVVKIPSSLEYSHEGLLQHIVKHTICDHESFNLIEKESFRKLLRFVRPSLSDKDIPHRSTVSREIQTQLSVVKQFLKDEFKKVNSQIHFTFDAGTSRALDAYFVVTVSYIKGVDSIAEDLTKAWEIVSTVIGFRKIEGPHTAETFAEILRLIFEEYGILHKIGYSTSDNHSANDKALRVLAPVVDEARRLALGEDADSWDPLIHRVRCTEHSLHLGAHHVIKTLNVSMARGGENGPSNLENLMELSLGDITDNLRDEIENLGGDYVLGDVIGKILAFTGLVRKSPQAMTFYLEQCKREDLRQIRPKTWVRTRWGSLYDLVKNMIEHRAAYDAFTALADRAASVPRLSGSKRYANYALDDAEWGLLEEIRRILMDPALAAQSFSRQKGSRSLYRSTAALEMIQDRWEAMLSRPGYQFTRPAIEAGLDNLRKWYRRMDDTDCYVLAMVLNPVIKLAYIRAAWADEYIKQAEDIVYRTFDRYLAKAPIPSPSHASGPSTAGALTSTSVLATNSESKDSSEGVEHGDNGYSMAYMLEYVKKTQAEQASKSKVPINARFEVENYLKADLCSSNTDALKWWTRNQKKYPTVARMAKDYLAIPASSTDSERAFSVARLIGTDHRTRLSPESFEALQVLRSAYAANLISLDEMVRLRAQYQAQA